MCLYVCVHILWCMQMIYTRYCALVTLSLSHRSHALSGPLSACQPASLPVLPCCSQNQRAPIKYHSNDSFAVAFAYLPCALTLLLLLLSYSLLLHPWAVACDMVQTVLHVAEVMHTCACVWVWLNTYVYWILFILYFVVVFVTAAL